MAPKRNSTAKATITIQVPKELAKQLQDEAGSRFTTLSFVVREILFAHIREKQRAA